MAKQTNNNIRLGIFVTLAVALFTLAIYYVGARKNIFGVQFHISTLVKNANGLQTGNNVRYSGIVVGSVKDIVFINDSTLQIDMVLDKKAKTFIRKNAVASIGMDGLVGNVIVNISPGKGDSPLAKDGDVIASYTRQETSDMLETLGSTNANVALLSMKLLEISTKLNEGPGTLPLLIRDSLMATEVAQSLHYLRIATENIAIISRQLQAASGNIAAGKGTVGYLLHDETLPHQLEAFVSRLDSAVIAQTEPVIADLKKSGADIAAASAELK
ncbi:MAG: MCE family protein, partial [Bacteroidetes bacterium]|nr:MCE family protein [Bacteroidota bacterium]